MRAVCFWAPLRLLFTDAIILAEFPEPWEYITPPVITIPLIVYLLPLLLGYINYYLKIMLWVLLGSAVVLFWSFIFLLIPIHIIIRNWIDRRLLEKEQDPAWWHVRSKKPPSKLEVNILEFRELFIAWMRSKHDQVCPSITEVDDKKD